MKSFIRSFKKEAIFIMESLEKENKKVVICEIDFDNDRESRKAATPREGSEIIMNGKTVVIHMDEFIPHIQVYSLFQKDLENIENKGIMHDIIFSQ
jgi:hypothetical protein